jgi:hypothetical protein
VARQLGHAKMTTTLLFYGHWPPKGDRLYVERMKKVRAAAPPLKMPPSPDATSLPLDRERLNAESWHHFGTTSKSNLAMT